MMVGYSWSQIRKEELTLEFIKRSVLCKRFVTSYKLQTYIYFLRKQQQQQQQQKQQQQSATATT